MNISYTLNDSTEKLENTLKVIEDELSFISKSMELCLIVFTPLLLKDKYLISKTLKNRNII